MLASASEFVGQQRARSLLTRYIERGRLSGTFLLLGQRGLGKTTLATIVARALCCTGARPASEPLSFSGECYACRSIAAGEQPEYVTVRPRGQDVSVKQLDEEHGGLATALYKPNLLSHRVFMIDNAHHLNEESGNRLLKLFEEAPAQTVFLLTTDRPELLLPTIHSRGQKITLSPLGSEELAAALAASGLDAQSASEGALLGGGRYVDSLALGGNKAWRRALTVLAEAIMRRSGVLEAAADAAGFEHALLWEKEQADHGMEEAELEKALPKARQNELTRQALVSAYDRASWWLLHTGNREQGSGNGDPQNRSAETRNPKPATRYAETRNPTPDTGIINMDDWEDGARGSGLGAPQTSLGDRGSGFGGPQRPQSDPRQRSAETGNPKPETRYAETRIPKPDTRYAETGNRKPDTRYADPRSQVPGPWGDPTYMAKLALLRRRISGNVDRELAQMAFEASL